MTRRLALAAVLVAAGALHARADDLDAPLRAQLARPYDPSAAQRTLWARGDAHFAGAPGDASLFVTHEDHPVGQIVIDQHGDAVRVEVTAMGARLGLWLSPADIVPSVTREAGVAATATAKIPGPNDDGLFLESGVRVDGERRGERVHVRYDNDGMTIDGWIAADAVGATAVMGTVSDDGWDLVPAGTKIMVGGKVIAVAQHGMRARTLPHGRGELSHYNWIARGKMIVPKGKVEEEVDGDPNGIEGGVVGGIARPDGEQVPDGACLYDGGGHLVGVVRSPEALAKVVRTGAGFDVAVAIVGVDGSTLALHARRIGNEVELCTN